jgi:hypothetical protein
VEHGTARGLKLGQRATEIIEAAWNPQVWGFAPALGAADHTAGDDGNV